MAAADAQAQVNTVRRYYLLKSQQCFLRWEEGLGAAMLGLLAKFPGQPLPAGFPLLSVLAAAHYTCWEDLDGANVRELLLYVPGIANARDAQTVLTAWAALTPPTVPEINTPTG